MAGNGPPPKAQRRRSNPPALGDWVVIPSAGRRGKAPALPDWRAWDARTLTWWTELWRKPQAAMWVKDGSTLFTLACLYDDLITEAKGSSALSAEIRQHEDRHGLSPKSLMSLRWRIDPAENPTKSPRSTGRYEHLRRGRLHIVDGGDSA